MRILFTTAAAALLALGLTVAANAQSGGMSQGGMSQGGMSQVA